MISRNVMLTCVQEIVCDLPYTSRSDIWSLGCVIYELCKLSPPFNANSHLSLCQKIKDGRYPPIPTQYSPELKRVIDSCLRVNPSERPDTGKLLELDVMRMIRREMEAANISKSFKIREEALRRKEVDLEAREKSLTKQLEDAAIQIRVEIDAELRVKWEAKADLEIQRRVETETRRLFENYEKEMVIRFEEAKLHIEQEAQRRVEEDHLSRRLSGLGVAKKNETPSVVVTSATSSTITSKSVSTAPSSPPSLSSKTGKLLRMEDYFPPPSPMDISMSSPFHGVKGNHLREQFETSPLAKRNSNLYYQIRSSSSDHSDDEDDEVDEMPLARKTKQVRPFPLISRKTAPVMSSEGMVSKSQKGLTTPTRGRTANAQLGGGALAKNRNGENRQSSPTRRLNFGTGTAAHENLGVGVKTAIFNNRAKSLRELAEENKKKAKLERGKENELEKSRNDDEVPVWDPEHDEMPSPFLVRKRVY